MTLKEKLAAAKPSTELFDCLSKEEKKVNDIMAEISYAIMDERRKRGMSQKEFATLLGVSQGMLSRWEGCDYNFSIQKVVSIFTKLDVDICFKRTSNIKSSTISAYKGSRMFTKIDRRTSKLPYDQISISKIGTVAV